MTPKFSIAICGGGIGGLSLAVSLSKYPNIKIDVYEAAKEFTEIGAGLSVWKRTYDLLAKLGCEDDLQKLATFPPPLSKDLAFRFRRADQPIGQDFHTLELEGGMITLHRAHLLEVLVRSLPPSCSHFGKRCISYFQSSPSDPVTLTFSDGATASADALIACDGINSVLRAQMYQDEMARTGDQTLEKYINPTWSGRVVYRILLPVERLKRSHPEHRVLKMPHMYCGKNKHVLIYPIMQGTKLSVAAYNTDNSKEDIPYAESGIPPPSLENLRSQYVGWEKELQDVIGCVEEVPLRWPVLALRPLPFYVRGTIALMGDAAHACTPHQGSGAGLGVEDAYLLGKLLGDPSTTKADLPAAFLAYEAIRLPRTRDVSIGSRQNGLNFELNGKYGDDISQVGKSITEVTSWISELDPDKDVEAAIGKMREFQSQANAV